MNEREISRTALLRALTAAAHRYDGLTYAQIGRAMGVGHARARDLVLKGEQLLRRRYRLLNTCAELTAAGVALSDDL